MSHDRPQALTMAMVPAAIFGMNLHSGWEVRLHTDDHPLNPLRRLRSYQGRNSAGAGLPDDYLDHNSQSSGRVPCPALLQLLETNLHS